MAVLHKKLPNHPSQGGQKEHGEEGTELSLRLGWQSDGLRLRKCFVSFSNQLKPFVCDVQRLFVGPNDGGNPKPQKLSRDYTE
jgi:hypothetical protein